MNPFEILQKEIIALQRIPIDTDIYFSVLQRIYNHTHVFSGKVVTSGIGKAGEVAKNIATTFCSTGTPAIFLHPAEALHGDIGVLQSKDILLLVSNSGKTKELIQLMKLQKHIYNITLPSILITGNPQSTLGKLVDYILPTGNPEEVCPLGLTPTTSTTVMSVIGDILVIGMMESNRFTVSEYYKRHHSGYLGKKAKNQIDEQAI